MEKFNVCLIHGQVYSERCPLCSPTSNIYEATIKCSSCGKLFLSDGSEICNGCLKGVELEG